MIRYRALAEDIRWAADFLKRELDAQPAWDRADRLHYAAAELESLASSLLVPRGKPKPAERIDWGKLRGDA